MKINITFLLVTLLMLLTVSLSSCSVVGDIFKAGMWSGILIVAAIIGVIIFIIVKMGRKS